MASACVVVDVVAKGAAAHVGSSKPKGLSEKRGANFRAAARSSRIARRSAARVAAPRTAVVTAAKGGSGDDEKDPGAEVESWSSFKSGDEDPAMASGFWEDMSFDEDDAAGDSAFAALKGLEVEAAPAKGPAAADAADVSSAKKGAGDLPQDPAMQSGLWDDVSIDDAESGDEGEGDFLPPTASQDPAMASGLWDNVSIDEGDSGATDSLQSGDEGLQSGLWENLSMDEMDAGAFAPPTEYPKTPQPAAASTEAPAAGGAAGEGEEDGEVDTGVDDEVVSSGTVRRKRSKQEKKEFKVKDINPLSLGRRSRKFVDNVFGQITGLANITKRPGSSDSMDDSIYDADLLSGIDYAEYDAPNAKFTTVLVTGATGRIGRVLVRKLLLRGYTVKALVRPGSMRRDLVPAVVEVVEGDIGDMDAIRAAMAGVNKVVYCARAASDITSDQLNVEELGVFNVCRAFQDYNNELAQRRAGRSAKTKVMLTNFKWPSALEEGAWEVDETDQKVDTAAAGGRWAAAAEVAQRVNFERLVDEEGDDTKFAVFSGFVFSRTGLAQASAPRSVLKPGLNSEAVRLERYEGLVLRLQGDKKRYSVVLTDSKGNNFCANFGTSGGWQTVRVPFSQFRPESIASQTVPWATAGGVGGGDGPLPELDLSDIVKMGIRYEARNQRDRAAAGGGGLDLDALSNNNSFRLVLEYVKAVPGGDETDFVLVSCGGQGMEEGEAKDKLMKFKRNGERSLRNSGLGYTIVRPGALLEEPGGSKALVFDQGNRITQPISCADVADVCVKALHNTEARNRSFDVCYEYDAEEESLYELVTHIPAKSNNYLTPALAVLDKNT